MAGHACYKDSLFFFVEIIIILKSCTASSELCLPRFPLLQIMDAPA